MNTHTRTARALADDALLARMKSLADRERDITTELIAHLVEVERRKLHLRSGYSSLFTYCRCALGLSESETFNRIRAARAARRFPVILDQLALGLVNLTTVKLLTPHLTAANHLDVLRSARGLGRRDVEKLVARLAPAPDVPTSVRKLPPPKSAPVAASPVAPGAADLFPAVPLIEARPSPAPPAPTPILTRAEARGAVVSALSPERYKLQVTITGETLGKLERAKDMLRHALPSGDVAQIVDRALTLLLADLDKKKFAATDRPRPVRGVAAHVAQATHVTQAREPRKASAPVRRIVSERDTRQCAFAGKDGRRCQERAFLEFHHVDPYVAGGPRTVPNITLFCQQHNLYEWHLRSTDVREREEEWLYRQVAAGIVPWTATTGPGTTCPETGHNGRSRTGKRGPDERPRPSP
jgi:hypothetical protein